MLLFIHTTQMNENKNEKVNILNRFKVSVAPFLFIERNFIDATVDVYHQTGISDINLYVYMYQQNNIKPFVCP